MNTNLLIILLGFVSICSKAQSAYKKNLIFVGVESTIGRYNAIKPLPVIKYGLAYGRFFNDNKLSLEGYLSYLSHYKHEQVVPFDYYFLSDRSQRITLDMSLLYSICRNRKNMVRLGAGPTIWYQKNSFARDLTVYLEQGGNAVSSVKFLRENKHQTALGINVTAMYDYAITNHLLIGIRGAISGSVFSTNTEPGTVYNLTTAGIRIGYTL